MVECVKERCTQFERKALAKFKCSLNGEVPVGQTGRHDGVSWAISKRSGGLWSKRARQNIWHREILQLIVNRTHAVRAFVEIIRAAATVGAEHGSGETITKCSCAGDLPVFQHVAEAIAVLRIWDPVDVSNDQSAALIE